MHIDLAVLASADGVHLVELLGGGQETLVELLVGGIVDWVIHNGFNALSLIECLHGDRVNASLLNLERRLKVQNLGHAS